MNSAGAGQDVDVVLTTRELGRLLRSLHVDAEKLEESDFDQPLGESTGAGVIFGVTGGVMEASLRSAYYLITGENADADAFSDIRSLDGWREATYTVNGIKLRLAVTNGLANTRRLMDAVKAGEVEYDFVEVMACPGGCVGGGGQPILDFHEQAPFRAPILYSLDKNAKLRRSHENPQVQKLYEDYMEKPLSHKSHELLHTDHSAWNMPR
jgi:NADH-quinone oxidoreductase subunit G